MVKSAETGLFTLRAAKATWPSVCGLRPGTLKTPPA
jgi:hypothetical protein